MPHAHIIEFDRDGNAHPFDPASLSVDTRPFIHIAVANGFPAQIYWRALQPLAMQYRLICANLRPLWSDVTPATWLTNWHQLADDLQIALKPLEGRPIVGLGHSLGAILTCYVAIRQPALFSHLVLLDPTFLHPRILLLAQLMRMLGQGNRIPLVKGALKRGNQWPTLQAAFEYFRGKRLFARWSDEVLWDYVHSGVVPHPSGDGYHLAFPPTWEAQIFKTLPTDLWRLPQLLKPPVLIIRGEFTDVFTPTSQRLFLRRAPHTRIETVIGTGHMVPQEAPIRVGSLIQEFLSVYSA